ncbi:MAG TPA: xanthine dehydrogenase family protein subunit M [Caldilineae bacterium]|nr:xanthine dehydrogenase family protein subunit M [Caldilineae bacterium]
MTSMVLWEHYHLPTSVPEALTLLARYDGRARIVAGGTDLILELEQGERPPVAALVDVSRIPGLNDIREEPGCIVVGAAATHTRIEASPLIRTYATCLAESCGVIGGPQVRNVATIGGNVAHALPAADGTVSLVALQAEAQIARLAEEAGRVMYEWRPIESLFRGPGQSAIDPTRELITAFRLRPHALGEGSAFARIMRPQGLALPILGVAARVRLSPDGMAYADVSICIGPAGPVPFRAQSAEAALIGKPAESASMEAAIAAAQEEARVRTSKYRATAEYRREMVGVLLRRVVNAAVARARRWLVVAAPTQP